MKQRVSYFCHFDMKDLGEALYVLGTQIICDKVNGVLRLSQKTYIDCVLKNLTCIHVLLGRHQL